MKAPAPIEFEPLPTHTGHPLQKVGKLCYDNGGSAYVRPAIRFRGRQIFETKYLRNIHDMEKFYHEITVFRLQHVESWVSLDVELGYYDDTTPRLILKGWREMTADENATVKDAYREWQEHQNHTQEYDKARQIAAAQKLLKAEGLLDE